MTKSGGQFAFASPTANFGRTRPPCPVYPRDLRPCNSHANSASYPQREGDECIPNVVLCVREGNRSSKHPCVSREMIGRPTLL